MAKILSYQPMNIVEAQRKAGFTNTAEFLGDLVRQNDILNFLPFLPANHGFFHEWTEANRLGKGAWGKANTAIPLISSGSDVQRASVFLYEGESQVDSRILEACDDKMATRDAEDASNLEGFMQGWLDQLFYATGDADSFVGLSARRSDPSTEQVWDAGGSGVNCTSLWLFEFGANGFNIRYPHGTQPGFSTEDKGMQRVLAPVGTGQMEAWVRHYKMWGGIQIKRQNALLRMGSIDSSNPFTADMFIEMKNTLPSRGRDAVAFANRDVHSMIEKEAWNKSNMAYSIADYEGFGPVTRVCGIPVMIAEAILSNEAAI